ncbi:MAG TPA: DUF2877 domain-containing protein [Acidimicrobiales bacterium]|nr:DUF2877 domain-containing protein [Acidimicrobiales bacterium]
MPSSTSTSAWRPRPGRAVTVLDAGDAWYDPPPEGTARVQAVFSRAAYLRIGDRLLAVCGPRVPAGPLHLRLSRLPALAPGFPVRLAAWRPGPHQRWNPPAVDLGACEWLDLPGVPALTRSAGLDPALVAAARPLVERGDVVALADLVGGCGPGLTPSGDDLLAGVLLVAALRDSAPAAARAEAALAPRTTDVARAFLHWAARGRSIAPVHHLLAALAQRDQEAAALALRALAGVGATSGAALALGVRLAL